MDCIKNIDDVKRFFRYLYEERKVAFHPDDKFEEYICHSTGEPSFSPTECEKYNRLMDECFITCADANESIYDIATELFKNIAS